MTDENERGDREWFEERIGSQLRRLDETFEPQPPERRAMEAFVAEGKAGLRRKFRRELILFWMVAAIVIGGMLWTIDRSWALFVALQALTALSAFGLLSVRLLRLIGKGNKQWKRS